MEEHETRYLGMYVERIIGTMGAGKTEIALARAHNLENDGLIVVSMKHRDDLRGEEDVIASRSKRSRPAYPVSTFHEIEDALRGDGRKIDDVDYFHIDEAGPFYSDTEEFMSMTIQLAKAGKFVLVSSLQVAGNGLDFPTMAELRLFGRESPVLDVPRRCSIKGCDHQHATHVIVSDAETGRPFRVISSRSGKRFPFKLPDSDRPEEHLYIYDAACYVDAFDIGRSVLAIDYEEFAEREGISPDEYEMV